MYHPYTQSSLGFSLAGDLTIENDTSVLLEDIDLYYQPTEQPTIAIIQFLIRFLYLCLGEYVQLKLLKMVNKENGLVNEVTQFYCITSMIVYPVWLLYETSTEFLHPLKDIVGHWFCVFGRLAIFFHLNVLLFHSFITALMRYCFIVHEGRVKYFGKLKTKKMFLIMAISLPILFVTWGVVENQEIAIFLSLNRCYGIDHKLFLAEVSTGKNMFCKMTSFGTNEMYDPIINTMREITCIIKFILTLFMSLNISEGLIYIKIFSHIKRFVVIIKFQKIDLITYNRILTICIYLLFREHSNNMENLKNLLVKSSKIKRNRRVLLNIQVQILAWMMEFLAAVVTIIMLFFPFAKLATMLASHFAALGFFVLVPSIYLLNSDHFKTSMIQNSWYLAFTRIFFSGFIDKIIPSEDGF